MLVRSISFDVLLAAPAPAADAAWRDFAAYPPPATPACRNVIVQYGESGIWVGHFSGRRYAGGDHGTAVYGRLGCFRSEAECRRWLGLNDAFAATSNIMSCRPLGGQAR
jgi:hypothetical protein